MRDVKYTDKEIIDAIKEFIRKTGETRIEKYVEYREIHNTSLPSKTTILRRLGSWEGVISMTEVHYKKSTSRYDWRAKSEYSKIRNVMIEFVETTSEYSYQSFENRYGQKPSRAVIEKHFGSFGNAIMELGFVPQEIRGVKKDYQKAFVSRKFVESCRKLDHIPESKKRFKKTNLPLSHKLMKSSEFEYARLQKKAYAVIRDGERFCQSSLCIETFSPKEKKDVFCSDKCRDYVQGREQKRVWKSEGRCQRCGKYRPYAKGKDFNCEECQKEGNLKNI